jgi:hypothetical protein
MQGKYAPAPMPFEELKRTDGGIRFRRTYLLTLGTRK